MGRNLIVGDIHSQYGLLQDVLSSASFSPTEDTLYSVGDIADRGPETVRLIQFLLSLPSYKPVLGNHDIWMVTRLSCLRTLSLCLDRLQQWNEDCEGLCSLRHLRKREDYDGRMAFQSTICPHRGQIYHHAWRNPFRMDDAGA